ncbi:F-type H+-transporting ATPase subunit c [Metamycoplasma subdolum]|uniref:ATP synthase subunit c n=1 Tax=Metamycoplasma subdolum TaxID=92407 RepID=A0A3M0A399_9BACT|nr:ATP synthase F0 subunit C [Metamycoplasma subdolum]RMA79117.1 F-type H+-transporting ATPase subunit c [Metamycoplasma subdolum]WPB50640.1 ATP synthase F0 subunit C [Metamycoplasma subdolum]
MNIEPIVNAYHSANASEGNLAYGLTMIAASLAIGGTGIVSLGQGIAVAKAVDAVGRNPEATAKIRGLMIIGLAFVETASIYCFIISLLLIFV